MKRSYEKESRSAQSTPLTDVLTRTNFSRFTVSDLTKFGLLRFAISLRVRDFYHVIVDEVQARVNYHA